MCFPYKNFILSGNDLLLKKIFNIKKIKPAQSFQFLYKINYLNNLSKNENILKTKLKEENVFSPDYNKFVNNKLLLQYFVNDILNLANKNKRNSFHQNNYEYKLSNNQIYSNNYFNNHINEKNLVISNSTTRNKMIKKIIKNIEKNYVGKLDKKQNNNLSKLLNGIMI